MQTKTDTPWYFVGVRNRHGVGQIMYMPVNLKDGTREKYPHTPHLLAFPDEAGEIYLDPRDRKDDYSFFENISEVLVAHVDFDTHRWKKFRFYLDGEMSSEEKSRYLIDLFQSKDQSGVLLRNAVIFYSDQKVLCMEYK